MLLNLFSVNAADKGSLAKKGNITTDNRPKTALVLSGGGARGAAHVGVLKVLEELNIPIDFVVGTSMGSIVGGLYSAGYSPAELENLIKNIDWDLALEDKPPREILSYKRKRADRDLLGVEVGFNKKGKFTVPEGIRAGQELGFILKNALQRVGNINSFSRLPIPFTAVATNIETGELVTLKQGDLAKSIRASMSVPGFFVPVTIGDLKLVDGGLVSNLPVQVARDMGAQRIIAVDIGSGLIAEDKLGDVLKVTLQMINVLMKQNVDNSITALKTGDLYIRPDLGDFSSANFKEAYTIIPKGYAAASSMRVRLGNFSVSPNQYASWQKTQRKAEPSHQPKIDFIEVKGEDRVDKRQILAHMKHKVGSQLNIKTLKTDLEKIYSIGDFESVGYDLIHRANGDTGLKIDVVEKPWGPNYLRGSLQLSDDFEGGGSYGLILNHRLSQLNSLGAEWDNTLELGKRRGFTTEFYQPLTYDAKYFVATKLGISKDTRDVYDNDDRVGEYTVDRNGIKLDLGWTPRSDTEVRLGLEYEKVKGRLRVGQTSATLPNVEANIGALNFSVGIDSLDNPYFPTKGLSAELKVKFAIKALGSDEEYNSAYLRANKFWSRGKGVYGTNLVLASSFDSELPIYENFSLGGLGKLSGLNNDQIDGEHLGLVNAFYYRPIGKLLPGNIGFSLEAGNVWQNSDDISFDNLIYSGSVFWSMDSLIGAVYLGYGITDDSNEAIHLSLGRPF